MNTSTTDRMLRTNLVRRVRGGCCFQRGRVSSRGRFARQPRLHATDEKVLPDPPAGGRPQNTVRRHERLCIEQMSLGPPAPTIARAGAADLGEVRNARPRSPVCSEGR